MIEKHINNLIRGKDNELDAYLNDVEINIKVPDTEAICHCYHVHLDGNGNNRVTDFIEFIARKVVDYAIPRSEFEKAKEYLNNYNSDSELAKLRIKAELLFTDLSKTGEGGEILLYIMVQTCLKIPQLLCKMPLKTSTSMHYHGVDGIHAEYDQEKDLLALYWGESKMYGDIKSGIEACFKSLKEYLIHENSSTAPQERDLQLAKDNLDLNDEQLENAIVEYFDKDSPKFRKLQYRGVCLVGYDSLHYPTEPNKMASNDIKELIVKELDGYKKLLSTSIGSYKFLNSFKIHVFLIPFPSVETFRSAFLKALHLK